MKRYAKLSIALLAVVAAGVLAFALYPALLPDTETDAARYAERLITDDQGNPVDAPVADLDVHHTVNIAAPTGFTRYIGDIYPNVFALLRDEKWDIHLTIRNGKLAVEASDLHLHAQSKWSRVIFSSAVEIVDRPGMEKQADGSYHPIYGVSLTFSAAVQPAFFGKTTSTLATQYLKVDPLAGSVDPEEPRVAVESLIGKHTALSARFPVNGLPSRLGATARERALNSMLFNLGKIDNGFLAAQAAKRIPDAAERMLRDCTDPEKPWPECWGEAAPLAAQCAKQIVPTLLYLQEKECFNAQALADFINSPTFARFFGETFTDKVPDPLDEPLEPFPIEKVQELDTEE